MAKKWPEKVIQRSFIKEHSFVNRLYFVTYRLESGIDIGSGKFEKKNKTKCANLG